MVDETILWYIWNERVEEESIENQVGKRWGLTWGLTWGVRWGLTWGVTWDLKISNRLTIRHLTKIRWGLQENNKIHVFQKKTITI